MPRRGEQMPLEPLDQEVADNAAREARWIEVWGFIMLFASFKIARLGVDQIVSRFGWVGSPMICAPSS